MGIFTWNGNLIRAGVLSLLFIGLCSCVQKNQNIDPTGTTVRVYDSNGYWTDSYDLVKTGFAGENSFYKSGAKCSIILDDNTKVVMPAGQCSNKN